MKQMDILCVETNKHKKGQALVEFILIIPVFLYLLLIIIDFSNLFYVKNDLYGLMNNVVDMYESHDSETDIRSFIRKDNSSNELNINIKEDTTTIKLYRKINFASIGLGYFFKNPYEVTISRVIKNG